MDYKPISNLEWKEYMYYQKDLFGDTSVEYLRTIPDTSIWAVFYPEEKFDGPILRYANAPVVGISHQQALEYCDWRTQVVNQKFKLKVTFSLPSAEHFLMVQKNKKFTTVSNELNVKKPPRNTFYNFYGEVPEYTVDKEVCIVKADDKGFCAPEESACTKYTIKTFRCVAFWK